MQENMQKEMQKGMTYAVRNQITRYKKSSL